MPEWVAGQKFVLKDVTLTGVSVNNNQTCWTLRFKDGELARAAKCFKKDIEKFGPLEEGSVIPAMQITCRESDYGLEFLASVPDSGGGGFRGGGGGGRQFVPKSLGAEHGPSICGLLKTKAEHGQSAADFWRCVGLYATCVLTLDQSGLQGLKALAAKKVGEGEK